MMSKRNMKRIKDVQFNKSDRFDGGFLRSSKRRKFMVNSVIVWRLQNLEREVATTMHAIIRYGKESSQIQANRSL
jgi:hypothetical protein